MKGNYHEIMRILEDKKGNLKMQIDRNADPARLFYQIMTGNNELCEAIMDAISAYAASESDIVKFYSRLCTITSYISETLKAQNTSTINFQHPIFSIVNNGKESN